jgi:hypothetical protein
MNFRHISFESKRLGDGIDGLEAERLSSSTPTIMEHYIRMCERKKVFF